MLDLNLPALGVAFRPPCSLRRRLRARVTGTLVIEVIFGGAVASGLFLYPLWALLRPADL